MRLTGVKVALATAIAAAGAVALPVLGGAASASTQAAATSSRVVVTCAGPGAVRPKGYIVVCRNASVMLMEMHWTAWAKTAVGHGQSLINDCRPSCLRGHFGFYPVNVTLQKAKPWPGHAGKSYYTKLVLTFTAAGPAGSAKTETFTLPSHGY